MTKAKHWYAGKPWGAIALIVGGLAVEGYAIYVAGQRQLSQLELELSQALTLVLTLAGSYVAGRHSALEAGVEIIRPHGRKAFRRLLSLHEGLLRLRDSIAARREFLTTVVDAANGTVNMTYVQTQLDLLGAQVAEQVGTALASLEDWRDIVPEDVAELERIANEKALGAEQL
jgi:hypothetical protein